MNRTVKLLLSINLILLIALATVEIMFTIDANNRQSSVPVRIACVGDSITRGTEYTLYLWGKLGPHYIVGDFGVGGTTISLNSESAYMNTTAFGLAQEFQPNIIVVMLGTNDAANYLNTSREHVLSSYTSLLAAFQSLSNKPKIYVVEPPPIFGNYTHLNGVILRETVLPAIREVAEKSGLTLIDAYTPLLDYSNYFIDGVHPDVEGAKMIADIVYNVLTSSMSK